MERERLYYNTLGARTHFNFKGRSDVTADPKKSIERENGTLTSLHSFSRGQVRIRMVVRVYIASSSGSVAVKKHQQAIVGFLEANRINFEEVDITMLEDQRFWMYRNIPEEKRPEKGNPLAPQIFNGDDYCGDYEDFFQSKETNTVSSFLRLPSVKDSES
ncbi:hypothetical protein R3I93_018901 [Phoxinus phoxinus]|uniref:SH3 domain-binding glutamic acid-rich-like protein n=2 Tax=Phoxinus phoxinus TaxID=58324 RepID=A0AAN9GXQ6_9TELE